MRRDVRTLLTLETPSVGGRFTRVPCARGHIRTHKLTYAFVTSENSLQVNGQAWTLQVFVLLLLERRAGKRSLPGRFETPRAREN